MLLGAMCCSQTSRLVLATGISVRVLNGWERAEQVSRNSWVAPGLKWTVRLSPSSELQRLSRLRYDPGYVPCTKFVLDDVEDGKVFQSCHKSEKLAIAFRLIHTSPSKKKSAGLQWLRHFHEVQFKNSWQSHCGEGCQPLSSLWRWCLLLHGLLVMPIG
jgi:hypothetical protein